MTTNDQNQSPASDDSEDRRAGAGVRVAFEALVAASATPEGEFEAESVDVSREGMRLRASYLPEVGEMIQCHFETAAGNVDVQGEVAWVKPGDPGGEIGICFTRTKREARDIIRQICKSPETVAMPMKPTHSLRGARIKLHIEGLGSPMKARVRDADADEVEVGSNLEFLKVGRTLAYEDVDLGMKREAYVDDVKVDIDPGSSIPQLVVTLRFDSVLGKVSPRPKTPQTRPVAVPHVARSAPAPRAAPKAESQSEPMVPDLDAGPPDESAPRRELTPSPQPAPSHLSADCADDGLSDDPEDEHEHASARDFDPDLSQAAPDDGADPHSAEPPAADDDELDPSSPRFAALKNAGERATKATSAAFSRLGPAMSGFGSKAKGAFGGIMDTVKRKKAERDDARRASQPRRKTSPPPAGGLKTAGRRGVVRDTSDAGEPEEAPKNKPRSAVKGAAVGLLSVVAIYGVANAAGWVGGEDDPMAEEGAARAVLTAEAAEAELPSLPAAGADGDAATADVPLFGATPMSTTETVMGGSAPDAPEGEGEPGAAADPGDEGGGADANLVRQWGKGSVKNPNVLKIKLDGPIEGMIGNEEGTGFTIKVPSRKTLSSVSQLARKDKRIAEVQAVNREDWTEVTVRFKDDVPDFLAKAKGDRLEIEISSKQVASN